MQALRKNLKEKRLPIFVINGHGNMDTRFENLITLKDNQYVIFFTKPGCSLNGTKCPGVNKTFTKILTNPEKSSILRKILMRNKNINNNNKPNIFKSPASFNPLLIYGPGSTVYNHLISIKPKPKNLYKESFGFYRINSTNKINRPTIPFDIFNLKDILARTKEGVFLLPICRACRNNQYKNVKPNQENKNLALYDYLKNLQRKNKSIKEMLATLFTEPKNFSRINFSRLKIKCTKNLINFIKGTKFQITKNVSNLLNKNAQEIAETRVGYRNSNTNFLSPNYINKIAGPAAKLNLEEQLRAAVGRKNNGNATSFTRQYLNLVNKYIKSTATSKRKRTPQPSPPKKRR